MPQILLYTPTYEHPVYKEGVAVPSMHEGSLFLKGGAHFIPVTQGGDPVFKGDTLSIRKAGLSIFCYIPIYIYPNIAQYTSINLIFSYIRLSMTTLSIRKG